MARGSINIRAELTESNSTRSELIFREISGKNWLTVTKKSHLNRKKRLTEQSHSDSECSCTVLTCGRLIF